MPSPIRIDIPNVVYEVTIRCYQERFLLRPSEELNKLIWGAFGRAQALYPDIRLYDLVAESNHYHALVSSTDGASRSLFFQYVNHRISFEAGRLHGWKGGIFCRPARPIACVTHEDQLHRFRYLRSHGVKENLVARAAEWPGVSALPCLRAGKEISGTFLWHDQATKAQRRAKGKPIDLRAFEEQYPVRFSKLPALEHLSWEEIHRYTDDLTRDIEDEFDAKRIHPPLGRQAILAQDPLDRPRKSKRSPAPPVHCADPGLRFRFCRMTKALTDALRAANRSLQQGVRDIIFPPFCHPTRLPYSSWEDVQSQSGTTGFVGLDIARETHSEHPAHETEANGPPSLLELLEDFGQCHLPI